MTNEQILWACLIVSIGISVHQHYRGNHWFDKYQELESEHTQLTLDNVNLKRDYDSLLVRKILAAIRVRPVLRPDRSKAEQN